MKIRIVKNWREAWKWLSLHALLWATVITTVWAELPPDVKASLPADLVSYVSSSILVFGIIGRFIDQEKKNASTEKRIK